MERVAGVSEAAVKDATPKHYNSSTRLADMTNRLLLALACVLLAVRLPSLVQPMGADQGLYAYVGERIRAGGLPYRDAWDQKPPAIHVTYAAMRAVWPARRRRSGCRPRHGGGRRRLLWRLGTRRSGPGRQAAAVVFLLLSNPAFARLGGVSVRAQCETFIAAIVTGAFLCLARSRGTQPSALAVLARVCSSAWRSRSSTTPWRTRPPACSLCSCGERRLLPRSSRSAAAFCYPVAAFGVWFAAGHALDGPVRCDDSRTTSATRARPIRAPAACRHYLLTFPVRHARVDALWLVGAQAVRCCARHGLAPSRRSAGRGARGWRRPACRSRSTAAASCRSTSSRPRPRSRSRPRGPDRSSGAAGAPCNVAIAAWCWSASGA